MKIHSKLSESLVKHKTQWIGILISETPYPKLYTQANLIKHKSPLHCIRYLQLCLKAGRAEEGDEIIKYYKLKFQSLATKNQNALFYAVTQWYSFFMYHSEHLELLDTDYLDNLQGEHETEAKYIGYYTLAFYHLTRTELEKTRHYFNKVEALYLEKLEGVDDVSTLKETIDVLLETKSIEELENYYEKNLSIFSKNSLHNRVALIRIASRRGDYERVCELVKPFPALLLPKYTHLMTELVTRKPVKFDRKKIYSDPDTMYLQILEGIGQSDPTMILNNSQANFITYSKVNPRIVAVCCIGIAWALSQFNLYPEALAMLRSTRLFPIDHDVMVFRQFTILNIAISCFGTDQPIQTIVKELLFHYRFLAKGKVMDNHLVPGFSDAIFILSCIDPIFEDYFTSRKVVYIFEHGVYVDGFLYTTPIYKALFVKKANNFSQENLKKARQRLAPKLQSDKPLIVIDYTRISNAAPSFKRGFPEAAAKITSRLSDLAACVNIAPCLEKSQTSSSGWMLDDLIISAENYQIQ